MRVPSESRVKSLAEKFKKKNRRKNEVEIKDLAQTKTQWSTELRKKK